MSIPTLPVTEPYPTLAEWAAWVDRVGGQWASREDLARIGQADDVPTNPAGADRHEG